MLMVCGCSGARQYLRNQQNFWSGCHQILSPALLILHPELHPENGSASSLSTTSSFQLSKGATIWFYRRPCARTTASASWLLAFSASLLPSPDVLRLLSAPSI